MANPDLNKLTESYFTRQLERTSKTLRQIVIRAQVTNGRTIPSEDSLAIHAGRRIDAAVMFMDICKFSDRPAWTEAEQQTLLQVISLLFTEMVRIIEDYGGVVEKNTGDGLMAYFMRAGTTSAQHRALAAALTMFDAKDRLINPVLVASEIQPIDFRICMDHGPITVAHVGAARGFRGIVAIGATANVASKMLAVAGANSILLGTKFLEGLPQAWVDKWIALRTSETGWLFRETGQPYAFWEYRGRWAGAM